MDNPQPNYRKILGEFPPPPPLLQRGIFLQGSLSHLLLLPFVASVVGGHSRVSSVLSPSPSVSVAIPLTPYHIDFCRDNFAKGVRGER